MRRLAFCVVLLTRAAAFMSPPRLLAAPLRRTSSSAPPFPLAAATVECPPPPLKIRYSSSDWFSNLIGIGGSQILWRVREHLAASVAVAIAVAALRAHGLLAPAGATSVIHSLLGGALSLLLVFRTNAACDRRAVGMWQLLPSTQRDPEMARGIDTGTTAGGRRARRSAACSPSRATARVRPLASTTRARAAALARRSARSQRSDLVMGSGNEVWQKD